VKEDEGGGEAVAEDGDIIRGWRHQEMDTERAGRPADAQARRCTPSLLQAGSGTACLFNELHMHTGALSGPRELSLRALRTFCNRQQATVQYNEFTTLTVPVSHPVLSLSRGRSVLLDDPYVHPVCLANYSALCAAKEKQMHQISAADGNGVLDEKTLDQARCYLSSAAALNASHATRPVTMSEAVVEAAELFFVNCLHGSDRTAKASDPTDCTKAPDKESAVNWFHFCLTLVRLLACSYRQTEISMVHWHEMLNLSTWYQENFRSYRDCLSAGAATCADARSLPL